MALVYTPEISPGERCPDFDLPSIAGPRVQRRDFQGPLLVMFICNHCPYVKAIEDRLIQLGHDLKNLGVDTVAISSNDAAEYPEDSFENLRQRAMQKKYSFPYLYDESQAVARAFGAVCTPDFFLYDRSGTLVYRGRLDNSWKDATKVTTRELYSAAQALVSGRTLPDVQVPSMGCSIKWKE